MKIETILARIRDTHSVRLNDSRSLIRMKGTGELAAQIGQIFRVIARRLGFEGMRPDLTTANFRRNDPQQMELGLSDPHGPSIHFTSQI